jgi:hypothetical protein
MSASQPFKCKMAGCPNMTGRIPHVCTPHFLQGWGRLPDMRLPEATPILPDAPAPLYVSDKDKKANYASFDPIYKDMKKKK